MDNLDLLLIILGVQSIVSMGCIIFGIYLGFRMGRASTGETITSVFPLKDMEDKDALDTEDIFTEAYNTDGIADPDERIETLS